MTKKLLEISHLNILSLSSKFNDFKLHLELSKIDIFALSETWLNSSTDNRSLNINDYNLIRQDRETRGGGVAFYINKLLRFDRLEMSSNIEQLWIKVKLNETWLAIGVFYKPPKLNHKYFIDELEESIAIAMSHCDKIICLGDSNINFFDINSPAYKYFSSMLSSTSMLQLISDATHITNHSRTLIDIILCNNESLIQSTSVGGLDLSNHECVTCKLDFSVPISIPKLYTYRSFEHFDECSFNHDLESSALDEIFYTQDINNKLNIFYTTLINLFDKHVPLKTVRINKKRAPWLTDNIKMLISQKNKAQAKHRKNPSIGSWAYYKMLRNAVNHAISREKEAYFKFISQSKNPKTLWQNLKSLNILPGKATCIPDHLTDPNILNDYFIDNIPKTIKINDARQYYSGMEICYNVFNFRLINSEIIADILSKLKPSRPGSDKIGLNLIRLCTPYILPYLVNIINSILLNGTFPDAWKNALVIPIPKISSPSALSDLRPISILPCLSKLIEKIMEIQMKDFIEKNNILPSIQSGFRQGYSCATALLHVTDDIIRATDNGQSTALVLLDYSKAFDTIDHSLLLTILSSCGFSLDALNVLKSYLTCRSQNVQVSDNVSGSRNIVSGVPQGSILGPLLFSVYTSQFVKYLKNCSIHMYADDMQLYYSFLANDYKQAESVINDELSVISRLSADHSLMLNSKKTAIMFFGNKNEVNMIQNNIRININGSQIFTVESARNLGLVLDRSMRFREQICSQTKKAYSSLRLLYPHRSTLSINTKKMLCETLVLSQFVFGAPVISPCVDLDAKRRMQRVQNSCIRFIYGIRKFDHVSFKLKELNWLNMEQRRTLYMLSLFHKIITTKTPQYLYNKIRYRSDVHNVNIRYKGVISPPLHKTGFFERSFTFNIYRMYNSVPSEYQSYSLKKFKAAMTQNLFIRA